MAYLEIHDSVAWDEITKATHIASFSLCHLAKLHLSQEGNRYIAEAILEFVSKLEHGFPEANLLKSQIRFHEGEAVDAQRIMEYVKETQPFAASCQHLRLENNSGLQVKLSISPDIQKNCTWHFDDDLKGFLLAQKFIYEKGRQHREHLEGLYGAKGILNYTIERVAETKQTLATLSFVDQEELFNSGNFAERTYREDLKGFFDWNWLWYEQDLKSGTRYEQQLSSLKSIGSRILHEVKSLDLYDLNELAEGVSENGDDTLRTTVRFLERGESDPEKWKELFLDYYEEDLLTKGKKPLNLFLSKLAKMSSSVLDRIKSSIGQELLILPEPQGCSKLEKVRLKVSVEIVKHALDGSGVPYYYRTILRIT